MVKLTLSLLFRACDDLRGNMDASEYKECTFGMLLAKRLSDLFDQEQEQPKKKLTAKARRRSGRTPRGLRSKPTKACAENGERMAALGSL